MLRLDDRVALVTGGGRGIGRGIALALAAEGASVVIDDVYVDDDGISAADATAEEIRAAGGRALGVHESVLTQGGAEAMVGAAVAEYGHLDTLVNCAGNVVKADLLDLSEGDWDSVINLHLKGHFLTCKAALPRMQEHGRGSIVTVASRGAFWDVPDNKLAKPETDRRPSSVAYSAAKAGIMALTTTLALELWETRISVNCLMPSANTQLFPGTKPNPVGGMPPPFTMEPDYLAPLVCYLATEAAEHISGRFFYASGGDVGVYPQPFRLDGGAVLLRKGGMWTIEELAQTLAPVIGVPAV